MVKKRNNTYQLFIGCAGWEYDGWIGTFYPKNLKREHHLGYYSDQFNFVEINSTFYNLPKENTVKHWFNQVPKDFLFTIKVWEKFTHRGRVLDVDLIKSFFNRMKILESKTFGFLVQFPPNFKHMSKNVEYLASMLNIFPPEHKYFIEFRDDSWFDPDVLEPILQPPNITLVTSYIEGVTPYYHPNQPVYYIRLIGDHQLQAFNKIQREQADALHDLEQNLRIFESSQNVRRMVVIFNNNFRGFAPEDANQLMKRMNIPHHQGRRQKSLLDFVK